MNVVIVYESLTGNTARAAEAIGRELASTGASVTVSKITEPDFQALALADLVVVGAWTDGLMLFGQRPGRAGRLKHFPPITGKKVAVFCTYALNPGRTLAKMEDIMSERGGEVLGGLAIKRSNIDEGAKELANRLAGAAST